MNDHPELEGEESPVRDPVARTSAESAPLVEPSTGPPADPDAESAEADVPQTRESAEAAPKSPSPALPHPDQTVSPHVEALFSRIEQLEGALVEKMDLVEMAASRLLDNDRERVEQRRIREALYEKLDASKPSFQFQLIRPLVLRLALLNDLVGEALQNPPADELGIRRLLMMLSNHLADTMQVQGISRCLPSPGEPFDPKYHYVVGTCPTRDPSQVDTIAETVVHGFVFFGQNDREGTIQPTVIRPARVLTWVHQAEAEPETRGVSESPDPPQPPDETSNPPTE